MNPQEMKFLWIAVIALAVACFAPTSIDSARRVACIRQQEAPSHEAQSLIPKKSADL